ncbi:hypothetical protein, partial [Escherichia coli]|uniref:hypothetical protein n=1 Tax=Escherichia coli TaxID=562 RepID=UPI003F4678CD
MHNLEQQAINQVKLQVPSFQGKSNPEEFLEWLKRTEMIFEYYEYPDHLRLRLAVIEFSGYALVWWEQVTIDRRRA